MDRSRSGFLCRTVRHINAPQGVLARGVSGVIRYEVENLGRELVFVGWDNGLLIPVFKDEIEVFVPQPEHIHV